MAWRNTGTTEGMLLSSGLFSANAAYTLAGWIRPVTVGAANLAICSLTVGTGNADLDNAVITSGGAYSFNAQVASTPATVTAGTATAAWHHFAMVRASTTALRIFVDGVQVGADSTANVSGRATLTHLAIGYAPFAPSVILNGGHYAWKAWTAALTAAELTREMSTVRPQRTANLWAWWPMVDSYTLGYDWAKARHLTPQGSLSYYASPPVPWGGV